MWPRIRHRSTSANRVLLTVSGVIPDDLEDAVAVGRRPRVDYVQLAAAMRADLLDYGAVRARQNSVGALIERCFGANVMLALACFRRRLDYDVIVTDGEQIGIPLAALSKLGRRSTRAKHMMVVHILSVPKKALLFRALRLRSGVDMFVVYCSAQKRFVIDRFGVDQRRVALQPFMVDTRFFRIAETRPSERARPVICAAGLERRDYATMLHAVADIDADVVIAAASPWSKRNSELDGATLPGNVSVVRLGLFELRQLYADASVVVMPLQPVDFQAGITTILEAMSMERPVVCTATAGQDDTVVEGETGLYVPHADAAAMQQAIEQLLASPDDSARLGAAARAWVVEHADVDVYARDLAALADSLRR